MPRNPPSPSSDDSSSERSLEFSDVFTASSEPEHLITSIGSKMDHILTYGNKNNDRAVTIE